jgi:hypothetical protein
MALTKPNITDSYFLNAVAEKIVKDTAADLKARVMSIIEPEIDAACERAARSLEPQLHAHVDLYGMKHVLQIITTKRSP